MDKLAQKIVLPTISGQPPISFEGPFPTLPGAAGRGKIRFESLGDVVSLLLQYLFPLAGFLLFILIVIGGFSWLTSAGDPKKVEAARNRITKAVVGFVLLFVSYWLVRILQMILSPNQPFF